MLVHRLEVRNWRGFTRDVKVDMDPGLNIIIGPNESGKTSLFEALTFAFFQRADTTKQEVRRTVPKGRQLYPHVAVEFEVDGAEYRIEKTFSVKRGHTLLCRRAGSERRPLAEDKDAEARLGELLVQDGFSQYAPALWAEQGEILAVLKGGVPGDLKSRLAEMLTGLLLTDEDRRIEEWVRGEWRQRFTPEKRRLKKHSPLERALSDLADTSRELEETRESWAAHEQRLRELRQAADQLSALLTQQEQQRASLEEARKAKTAWDAYRRLAAEAQAAATHADTLVKLRQRWVELTEKLESMEGSLAKARALVAQAEQALQSAQAEHVRAEETVKTLVQAQERLETQQKLVHLLRARSLANYLQRLRDSEPLAPSSEEMNELQRQVNKLNTLRARLESLALRVRLEPAVQVGVSVSLDGQTPHRLDAAAGQVYEWKATQSASLHLQQVASVTVETGMGDAAKLQRQIEAAERTLGDQLSRWLTPEAYAQAAPAAQAGPARAVTELSTKPSLESWWQLLQERFAEAERIRTEYGRTEAVYRATYSDLPRERIQEELKALYRAHPWAQKLAESERWLGKTDDELRALQVRLQEEYATIQQRLSSARAEEKEKSNQATEKRVAFEKAKSHLDHVAKERTERLAELSALKQEVRRREPGLAVYTAPEWTEQESFDPNRERNSELLVQLTEAARQASERSANLSRRAAEQRPAGEEVSDKDIQTLEAALKEVTGKVERKKTEHDTLQGQIKQAADGLADRLHELEERYEDHLRIARELALDAQAWDLLQLTLQQEHAELTKSVLDPVQRRIEPLLERLTGGRYRAVSVSDDNLSPTTLQGAHGEFEVGARELSYGTEEQLAFVTRLALAELLTADSAPTDGSHQPPSGGGKRQVLVMDDPLVNTDPARLEVAWQILLEAAARLQLIILTCHPVPNEAASRARLIRLEG